QQGVTPTARTTLCQPDAVPEVGVPLVATWITRSMLPGRCTTSSSTGKLQHTATITSVATSHDRGIFGRDATRKASPTPTSTRSGSTYVNCACAVKLATSAVSGSRRYSPHASDDARQMSRVNGKISEAG